jgi:hypothetical protein
MALIAAAFLGLPAKRHSDQRDAGGVRLGSTSGEPVRRGYRKNSGLFHQALLQTDALAVLEINCRNNQHGSLGE